ncbi:ATP-dependent DNA helicase RecG [Microaerobacter geothermalis]|uniref:ATP-dependent DNA helicase RecG n=1 Tax=Microaerobacter geothermalis TaxID=674972 RepID=UPI0038B22F8F
MNLYQSVSVLKGVGKEKEKDLHSLGIFTIHDLLEYLPYRYEDYTVKDLASVSDGEKVTIIATVYGEPVLRHYGKKSRLSVRLLSEKLLITAVFFNRPFLKRQLQSGKEIIVTGKWELGKKQIVVQHYRYALDKHIKDLNSLHPVYSVTGSLTIGDMRKFMKEAISVGIHGIKEILPSDLVKKYRLMSRGEAIKLLHFPVDAESGKMAKRRFVYEELFLFQLKMLAHRYLSRQEKEGIQHSVDVNSLKKFIDTLPFSLTDAQKRVLREILSDMKSPYVMNRLLQGDVGSGKTVVAAIALFASVKAGFQGALMVPTEILAEQHYQSLHSLLSPHGIEVALLTGSATPRQRKDILGQLQMGLIDVLIGTHALIQEDVSFRRLGLVITDEQHRFGVEQRRILRQKGEHPDVLLMTATPIPRTLAITAYGDMDVSVIDELPLGRKPIETYIANFSMLDRVLQFIRKELKKGRQAYVICPLIEESEKLDLENAIDVHAQLREYFSPMGFTVGLMHGRLSPQEKEEVMKSFANQEIHILVSTTVVEVGVNVPNATVMLVYHAERFGLAQLHQLRGRVGRGSEQSYCIFLADPKTEVGKARMKILKDTDDGFEIARRDMELRGPGDILGTKQSGLPEFKMADIVRDYKILEIARRDAAHLVQQDSFWTESSFQPLRDYLQKEGILLGHKLD